MDLANGFILGEWQVLPLEGRIVRADNGESRRVRRKAMDVLCALAAQPGQVAERDDLLAAVWGRQAVSDEPLTSTIGELRRLLGEQAGQERRYIETIPKRGYRLLAAVQPLAAEAAPAGTTIQANEPAAPQPSDDVLSDARLRPSVQLDWRTLLALALIVALIALVVVRLTAPVTPAAPAAPDNSIAVLPFEALTRQADQNFLTDGLAEELITLLTRLPTLRVAARNSSFALRNAAATVTEIARQLNVAHVLTGSVQQIGNQVRVTAQLVDARSGYQLWSATYDRTLQDIFAIQDEIAREVQAELQLQLLGNRVTARATDARAYTLYLQARHVGRQHTKTSLQRAAELYESALAIDSEYVPAWNDLAGVYLNQVGFAMLPPQEGYRRASEAAYNALAIDPDFAPAHGRLGWIALHANGNLATAARHYRRALLAEPANDVIRSGAAPVALALGRLDDAIALFEQSVAVDPVSPASHANLANAYLLARRYPAAEQSIRNALTLSPDYAAAHYRLGRALLAQDKLSAAQQAMTAEPIDAARWIGLAMVAASNDDLKASDAALAEVEGRYGNAAAGNLAQAHAHRGEIDRAFHWLDVEYETSGAGAFGEYRWDPVFDPLRSDARWDTLMAQVGLDDTALAGIVFPTVAELEAITGR